MASKTRFGGKTFTQTNSQITAQLKDPSVNKFDNLIITTSEPVISPQLTIEKEQPAGSFDFNRVITKEIPVAANTFSQGDEQFGVLGHVDSIRSMFDSAEHGINSLREEMNDEAASDTLISRIISYIKTQYANADVDNDILDRFFGDVLEKTGEKIPTLRKFGRFTIKKPGDAVDDGLTLKENDHTALFGTGKAIRNDIREMQQLRAALLRYRRWQQRQLKIRKGDLQKTRNEIPVKHRELSTLNRQRIEARGDYQIVQQLVIENWQEIAEQYAVREEVLNNHQGLFYARVRETPLSRVLPRQLPLRHVDPDDIVPGCSMQDQDLPEALEPFMETVLEIAIADWRSLRSHYRELPNRKRIADWIARRELRINYRLNHTFPSTGNALALRMTHLTKHNQVLIRESSRGHLTRDNSLLEYQRESRQILSLEDLLSGSGHRLRGRGEILNNRLNQASICLLNALRNIRPSLRLDWAQAAEGDSLNVARPESWPGMEYASTDDFNGTRTLHELIEWWFRQLHTEASANSHSAVRNLIRACLLISANDDPDDLLQGHLKTIPGRLLLGDTVRVSLNRETLPGTVLQLLDRENRLVSTLRVDDFDDEGAVTTITRIIDAGTVPNSGFTCTGFALPGVSRY